MSVDLARSNSGSSSRFSSSSRSRMAKSRVKTRLAAAVLWLLSASFLGGCAGTRPGATRVPLAAAIADPPRRPGKPLVLIAMPESESFHAVRRTLMGELKKDFDVVTAIVDRQTSAADFRRRIDHAGPACVVLMNNPTVSLYREYQRSRAGGAPPPPAVIVMASFLEELRSDLPNTSGVTYEVPGVTAFVNLRSIIQRPVNRVGVLHRPAFRQYIARQKALAAKEQITLVPVEVPADPSASEIRNALRSMQASAPIDALWVLNDNGLIKNTSFVETVWRPAIAALDAPVVVGVPTLVSSEARFGTFAVLPDHDGLGVQAANVVFEVAEQQWRAGEVPVELPVSTVTVVNMREARERFGLREGAAERIDRAAE